MNALLEFPDAQTPVQRILARYSRDELSGFVEVAIALLDLAGGDSDVEANGDELDGTGGEDDFVDHSRFRGEPGCPVSDPGCGEYDDLEPEDAL